MTRGLIILAIAALVVACTPEPKPPAAHWETVCLRSHVELWPLQSIKKIGATGVPAIETTIVQVCDARAWRCKVNDEQPPGGVNACPMIPGLQPPLHPSQSL